MSLKFLSLACSCALLAACGQRGPLFLPEEAPVEVRQRSGQTPAAKPVEPATEQAAEPATTQPPQPQGEPVPKPDEPDEEATGPDAGKPR